MIRHVLLDTGPLVASINRRDRFHVWMLDVMGQIVPPLLTCEPVLAESCFLLKNVSGAHKTLLELLHRGVIKVDFRLEEHALRLSKLMSKYADTPMSLADACLVRMSEIFSESTVLTFDSDFTVYRRHGRQVIHVLSPRPKKPPQC